MKPIRVIFNIKRRIRLNNASIYFEKLISMLFVQIIITGIIAQESSTIQSIYFTNLRQEDGLPSNMINTVEQDKLGFIWIGTDDGLCRWDGYQTSIFRESIEPGSLPNSNIRSLLLDDDLLWIGTWKGLCTINTQTFEITPFNIGENASVRSLYKSKDNRIWIGTSNGLIIYDKSINQYEYFNNVNSKLSHSTIRCLYETSDSTMWIGTYDQLNSYKKGKFESYDLKGSYKPFLKNNLILDIKPLVPDNDSILLIGTETGLAKFNRTTHHHILFNSSNTSISNEVIKCIHHENNKLWLGTDFGLNIATSDLNKIDAYFHNPILNQSIANNVIWKIFKDNTNTQWLLTSNGISLINTENSFYNLHEEYYTINNQQVGNQIRDILISKDESMYVATIHGVIENKTNQKKTYFTASSKTSHKLLLDNTYALLEDPLGRIWMGTAAGINIWSPKDESMRSVSSDKTNGLTSNYINSFAITSDKSIWVSAWEGGIFKITGEINSLENLRFVRTEKSAPDRIYSCGNDIYYLKSNQLWSVNNKNLAPFSVDAINNLINNESILCLNTINNKSLLIATNKLIIHYQPSISKIETYPINNPVINNPISIEMDKQNDIWMASINSVIKYNSLTGNIISMPLDANSPIKSFYKGCSTVSSSGVVYFGGDNGYIASNPEEDELTIMPPKAILSSLHINNELYQTTANENIQRDIPYLNELVFSYANNSLTFFFSTLNYWHPEKSYFRYRLKNFDNDWNNSLNTNFANYPNLKPGEYTLEIESFNYTGIKSKDISSFSVIILPPLWLSKPFLALYFVLMVGLTYLIFRIFVARQKFNNQLRLANLEKQHSEEILNTKQQFFTNISHEFRTPLSLIMPPIKQVIDSGLVAGKNLDMLQLAEKNSKRLLTLVNQILDFRKLETESIPLIKSDVELVAFCNEIFESFKDMASRHEIKYEFESNASQFVTSIDREKTEAILFNILANAFKHTPIEGTITVKLKIPSNLNTIEVSVCDSGSGIPEQELEKIFDHFYQADIHRKHKQGTGIGLAMAKQYALLHKGKIDVQSEVDKGSTFTYSFPAEKADGRISKHIHYSNKQVNTSTKTVKSDKLNKVLIIDDNPDILDYIEMNLNTFFQIYRASNGQSGLEMVDQINPDIIVSDIMMPIMDGIELCKKIKNNVQYQRIPVILLTAKALDNQKTEGIESGANMYITKPFDIAYLKACINNLIKTETVIYEYIRNKMIINPEPNRSSENNQNEQFIKKVMEIIAENVSNPDLTVDFISSNIGMSSTHLYRKIKAITNQSTKDVIKNYRLNMAAQMLTNNEGNITEIMYNVGFSSLSSFSKSFKVMFGCNPSEYKNQKTD
ncbi:hybrid sensor histidine kinase/response regulator transcription factor [Carboxylicivirga caseinilyticus]|uniref:hybrid sensor histidine kinase/response regulator transcription factor n=1 Tax=Carboxylicivirga caseinilyticus TaxID=3417572 RepID=UPI003D32754E|nr:response regulator [Marinilabiliaceae bacterium A049]